MVDHYGVVGLNRQIVVKPPNPFHSHITPIPQMKTRFRRPYDCSIVNRFHNVIAPGQDTAKFD